jgi:hypothetical protein
MQFLRKTIREIVSNKLLKEEVINKILYHGSPYRFINFKSNLTFFSETKDFASNYSSQKSLDYAMDEEPNIYEVEVLVDIFNIENKGDFEKMKNKLPEKIKVNLTNFPISTEINKDEILMNLRGFYIDKPYEEAVNAKIGDEIPTFDKEVYVVYKTDDGFAYGFNKRNYLSYLEKAFSYNQDNYGYNRELLNVFKELNDFIKTYIKENTEEKYVSNYLLYDFVQMFKNKDKKIESIYIEKFNKLYEKAKIELKNKLIEKGYIKKFIRKPTKEYLEDTWRYYENDTVINIIKSLGYGGYVAKERKVNTYAIFEPDKSVKILSYEFPEGFKFKTIEEYKKYNEFSHDIYKHFGEESWKIERYNIYKMFKENFNLKEAIEEIKKEISRW